MKWILSRYNHPDDWRQDYPGEYVIYDRSDEPLEGSIVMPNIGSDWYDKFTYIIDNYENLPEVAIYAKFNIFKYITREEFDLIKYSNKFTPILTQKHQTIPGVSFYEDGLYWEINNGWYLNAHPAKHDVEELMRLLGIWNLKYVPFAPGSGYIVPREVIHKYPKEFYAKLRSYLDWTVYPGEAQIIERGMYTLWNS